MFSLHGATRTDGNNDVVCKCTSLGQLKNNNFQNSSRPLCEFDSLLRTLWFIETER